MESHPTLRYMRNGLLIRDKHASVQLVASVGAVREVGYWTYSARGIARWTALLLNLRAYNASTGRWLWSWIHLPRFLRWFTLFLA